jgi:hypothetical protein
MANICVEDVFGGATNVRESNIEFIKVFINCNECKI